MNKQIFLKESTLKAMQEMNEKTNRERERERKRKTNTHNELNQFSGVKFPERKCTKWMPGWWRIHTKSLQY